MQCALRLLAVAKDAQDLFAEETFELTHEALWFLA